MKCQVSARHTYCLDELPKTFDECVTWVCEDCVQEAGKKRRLIYDGENFDKDPYKELDLVNPLIKFCTEVGNQPLKGSTANETHADCSINQKNDVTETSVIAEKELGCVTEKESGTEMPWNIAVHYGAIQDESFIGSTNKILNVIAPQQISEAIEKTSKINDFDCRVPGSHSMDMPKQIAASISQPLQSENHASLGEQNQLEKQIIIVVTSPSIQKCSNLTSKRPNNTVPSESSSSMASITNIQQIETATHLQEVVSDTMLQESWGREKGTSSSDQNCGQTLGTSFLRSSNEMMNPDEASSVDNSVTLVGSYLVKSSLAPILGNILKKYGDIAQDCQFHSKLIRSSILEGLCMIVQKYQGMPFKRLCDHHLNDLDSAVKDFESVKVDVKWLRKQHDELKETLCQLKRYEELKHSFAKNNVMAESLKATLDSKKDEVSRLQLDVQSLENQFGSLTAETEDLSNSIRDVKSKYKRFERSLVEGVL